MQFCLFKYLIVSLMHEKACVSSVKNSRDFHVRAYNVVHLSTKREFRHETFRIKSLDIKTPVVLKCPER